MNSRLFFFTLLCFIYLSGASARRVCCKVRGRPPFITTRPTCLRFREELFLSTSVTEYAAKWGTNIRSSQREKGAAVSEERWFIPVYVTNKQLLYLLRSIFDMKSRPP
eukprot:IDg22076t1